MTLVLNGFSFQKTGGRAIPTKAVFLYLNIGRGHPFYLDGIIDALNRSGNTSLIRTSEDILEISSGISRLGWQAVKQFYRLGSRPGLVGKIYERLRRTTDYDESGITHFILGASLRGRYSAGHSPIIVSHPLLVSMLREHQDLIYQHGELVVPAEAVVKGAKLIIVPTESAAAVFRRAGYSDGNMFISGLCIEPPLVRQARDSYQMRLQRYAAEVPLTGAFYSSGAEPPLHIEKLIASALAAVFLGQRAVIFAPTGGDLAERFCAACSKNDVHLEELTTSSPMPSELPAAVLVQYTNRREENHFTSKLFPWFDYFVAPSHERTNWAIGLGLPMFILDPPIGSYAPLNRALALDHGVAVAMSSMSHAFSFGARLESLRRRGTLGEMARSGWGRYDIRGFETIASFLSERFKDSPRQNASS